MAVYNTQRYVDQAVRSIIDQTCRDFEFIIIDDGSTDDSADILDAWSQRDGRIRLTRRANTGLTIALNEGIALSRSNLIARMDADDISLPTRFGQQVAYLHDHPDCVAVGCQMIRIDPDGNELPTRRHPVSHDGIIDMLLTGLGALPHPGIMVRRQALTAINGYDPHFKLSQDVDLCLRLAEHGQLANIDQPLMKYRMHPQSASTQRHASQRQAAALAVKQAYRRNRLPAVRLDVNLRKSWILAIKVLLCRCSPRLYFAGCVPYYWLIRLWRRRKSP